MKILQITNKVPVPPKDGGSIASFRLTEGLVKNGHDLHILAMNTSKHYVDPEVVRSFERPGLSITPVWMNTKINLFKALLNLLFSPLPYNAVRFISGRFKKALADTLKRENPDLIILENLYPAAYLNLIRKLSDSPVAYRAHNIEYEIWQRTAENTNGIKRWYLEILARRIRKFETRLINQYDLLIPITERDAASLDQMGNTKPVFVLPTGYYPAKKEPVPIIGGSPAIAHLGALDWLPNQEGLTWFINKVWPTLKEKIPGIEFHIAGRNAPAWFVRDIAADGIIFHGEIDDAETFITKYAVHVVPLLSGSGMRIKIVEAMAYGRAVVTSSLGTEGIDTESDVNILIADNQEDFAKHIIHLMEDTEFCRRIGGNAFTFVRQKLDNDKLVSDLQEFLKVNI